MNIAQVLWLSAALAAGGQAGNSTHVLDLVGAKATSQGPERVATGLPEGAIAIGGHAASAKPGLKLKLVSLDRQTYETGDTVVYEVSIENVSNQVVIIPWSAELPDGDARQPDVSQAGLFLEVRDPTRAQRLAWLSPQILVGAPRFGGTTQSIAPGETALIRAFGTWHSTESETLRVLRQPGGVVGLAAVFHLYRSHMLVKSDNAIEVVIRSSRRP